ncbi:MAG: penicillin-binding protein 2 [Lachnospiraceae bacterium]|nr:penicillin-binding protein 2 [Lachnospiraceae bacterium]
MKKNHDKEKNPNHELHIIMYIFVAAFLVITLFFSSYVYLYAPKTINSAYNMRQQNLEKKVIRGTIYSADGEILAEEALNKDNVEVRYYPYKEIFAHAAGYSTHGRSGVEYAGNIALLTSNAPVNERLKAEMAGKRNYGDNVITTFDTRLQKTAYDALGVYKGAVIVMEAKTGRILAMVSKPDFDPNTVSENWAEVSSDTENSPLVNRATQGLYPPGSTFKTVTLLEYIRENPGSFSDYRFNCKGSFSYGDSKISCFHSTVHGQVDLLEAYEKSCNSAFANIGTLLDPDSLNETAEKLLFNKELPFDIASGKSSFVLNGDSSGEEIVQSAIGQGNTLMTPAHMALITCAIANKGMLMKPYEIERIENYRGTVIKEYEPKEYKRLMSEEEAEILKEYMTDAVENGTGRKLKDLPSGAAGKTGSAEYGTVKGNSHSWFTGFSDPEDPDIVVTIIMEGAGSGSDYAVPMARRIFEARGSR